MSKPMDTFESFSFPKPINDAIKKMGFETPTPIQSQSIPLAIEGKDIVSMAQTGSGKTYTMEGYEYTPSSKGNSRDVRPIIKESVEDAGITL